MGMSMRKLGFALAALAAALLVLPAGAGAELRHQLPPGSSQLDQYIATVPDSGGGRPAGTVRAGNPGILPSGTAGQLNHGGPAGAAAARVALATAPAAAGVGGGSHGAGQSSSGGKDGKEGEGAKGGGGDQGGGSSSGLGDIAGALLGSNGPGSGGGLGIALPLILAAIAVAGIAYVVRLRFGNRPAR
jgi:hypothetical protein